MFGMGVKVDCSIPYGEQKGVTAAQYAKACTPPGGPDASGPKAELAAATSADQASA